MTGDLVTNVDGSRVLVIRNVVLNGLASRIGVLPGDQVISINGLAPGDAFDLASAVQFALSHNGPVSLRYPKSMAEDLADLGVKSGGS